MSVSLEVITKYRFYTFIVYSITVKYRFHTFIVYPITVHVSGDTGIDD